MDITPGVGFTLLVDGQPVDAGTPFLTAGNRLFFGDGDAIAVRNTLVEISQLALVTDVDGDSVLDDSDNCPFVANTDQDNGDALPAGDACQCGDVNNDFIVNGLDVQIARENLVGHTPLSGDFHPERCNVIGTSDCGVDDIFVLDRVSQGLPVSLQNICDAYLAP
jgi:hypothetical protein